VPHGRNLHHRGFGGQISHVAHRNVDWKLFFRLVIPGVFGGVLAAFVLTSIDASVAKPFVLTLSHRSSAFIFLLAASWHRHTEKASQDRLPAGLGRRIP
jgi:uncharacterized membrane protein YfcA